mgnify:CR=1 FL=1
MKVMDYDLVRGPGTKACARHPASVPMIIDSCAAWRHPIAMKRQLCFIVCLHALLLLVLLSGCTSSTDKSAEWLALGSDIITQQAIAAIPQGIYMDPTRWIEESSTATVDNEQMPTWATDEYAACVHWQRRYTRQEINSNRSPGEPQRWDITGEAEGWVLLADDTFQILSLTLTEQRSGEPRIIHVIDAWDNPT